MAHRAHLVVFICVMLSTSQLNSLKADTVNGTYGTALADQIAPEFTITQLDGTNFKLADYRGVKSVYLVFWNTWCNYCMKKIPHLKNIQSELSEQIKIIAVNTSLNDSAEASKQFQRVQNINYPLAFDHDKSVTELYGVWGTPTEFIIDINGMIQHRDHVPTNLKPMLEQWNKRDI